jgi:predicted DNA-binding ribbon-helix-helix protein
MPPKNNERIHVGFKLDKPVYEELKALAAAEHQTVSGLLRKLIEAVMESINS